MTREGYFLNHIAVVRSDFLPISETFIYGEIRQMKRYEPYIFCERRKNSSSFPYQNVNVDPRYKKLEQMLRKHSFQLLHARFGTSGIKMMPLKRKWNIPLVTSFHGCDSPGTKRMKNKKKSLQRLFSIGDFFTVPCQAMKKDLIKHGCPEDKIAVQYSGIELNQFPYKERILPTVGPVKIVYTGRLVEKKGTALLIKAFQKVHQIFPQTHLTLIGDGELKKSLVQLSKRLHLEKHIDFLGSLPHDKVAEELEKAHIFCLPSMKDRTGNQEGIPNAVKEAMACGLPVVSTFHSGIPELIEDGETGLLVAEKDINGIAEKLIYLIKHPETWNILGKKARAKIETDFNVQIQTDKLEQLFDRVIKAHDTSESKKPFFSVIIPTYNRERFIGKAINSVLGQSCKDFEIIVVDDGSKDQTKKIVMSYGPNVRYVYQKNQGPSAARNTGIRMAKGKFLAFLDSDDQFLPNKLKKNKEFLEAHPNSQFLYSWYYDYRNGRKRRLIRNLKGYSDIRKLRLHLYNRKFTIRTSTVVIHQSCFDKIGLFNTDYRYSQDWDMWLRLACHYQGFCQKKPLALYRRHHRKRISGGKRHLKIRKNAFKLYKRNGAAMFRAKR